MKTLHFKSKAAFKKWTAYGHIHKVFKETPPGEKIIIRGKVHKVIHDFVNKRKKHNWRLA